MIHLLYVFVYEAFSSRCRDMPMILFYSIVRPHV